MRGASLRIEGSAAARASTRSNGASHNEKLRGPGDNDMRGVGWGNMLRAAIAELYCVETRKKVLTGTEKGWRKR